jgi:hypothetical protein
MELNDQTIETSSEMKIKQEQGNHDWNGMAKDKMKDRE